MLAFGRTERPVLGRAHRKHTARRTISAAIGSVWRNCQQWKMHRENVAWHDLFLLQHLACDVDECYDDTCKTPLTPQRLVSVPWTLYTLWIRHFFFLVLIHEKVHLNQGQLVVWHFIDFVWHAVFQASGLLQNRDYIQYYSNNYLFAPWPFS